MDQLLEPLTARQPRGSSGRFSPGPKAISWIPLSARLHSDTLGVGRIAGLVTRPGIVVDIDWSTDELRCARLDPARSSARSAEA